MTNLRTFIISTAALAGIAFASPVLATELNAPQGDILLTVSGEISNTNASGVAQFDLKMLKALEQSEITTDTIWTAGEHVFTGVRLDVLLDHLGAQGTTLAATAINDYSVDIPTSDAKPEGPIVAYAMDGKEMSRRDKGPLWVIYPYASSSEYRTEVIYSRSIWQLDRLEVSD